MAVATSRGRSELQQRKWKERENTISPERTRVWAEPSNKLKTNNNGESQTRQATIAPVVYYLSRNGQLEHPHFMEVPLSSPDGLFLRGIFSLFLLFILLIEMGYSPTWIKLKGIGHFYKLVS